MMIVRATLALLALGSLFAPFAVNVTAAAERPAKTFPVYDNMGFPGKPDTGTAGLILSNILYEGVIWPKRKGEGALPDRSAFRNLVKQHSANPGPLVIDIELLPIKGAAAQANERTLATIADWTHEDAPGKVIGFYGTGTLTKVPPEDISLARDLARHVDAFFPPMYTFDDDRHAWAKRARTEADEDRHLAPGKPVYFYLWPQYHDKTPKQFQWVDSSYWRYQLDNARETADGIVIWGTSKYPWDDSTGWWEATQDFMRSLRPRGGGY